MCAEIQVQSRLVDVESRVAKMIIDETRHEETKKMLTTKLMQIPLGLPCHCIPFAQNRAFFGRSQEVRQCRHILAPTGTLKMSDSIALHGVGGIGKTSIALEIAHEEKSSRRVIIWISADDSTKLAEGFVEAARRLDLHQANGSAETDRRNVLEWLEKTTEPWLIIFDNAETPDDLQGYLPTAGNGAYLITSRNPQCQHSLGIEGRKITSFDHEDGKMFLLGMLPGTEQGDAEVQKAAVELSKYMGGSALGLKQMAGFMRETGCSICDLLTSLRDKEQERDIFADPQPLAMLGYSRSLANAWSMSLSALTETEKNILLFFSFMDPDNIQEHITNTLRDSCQHYKTLFPSATTNVKFLKSIRTLTRYGLIEKYENDTNFAIHRLIQATALHLATEKERSDLFESIIKMFLQEHPQSQATSDTLFGRWNICAIYAAHLLRLQVLMKEWKLVPKSSGQLWILFFNCSRYLLETGAMAKSLSLIEDTVPLCNDHTTENLVNLTYLHNARGLIALQHQQQAEARAWFEKAFVVRREQLGELNVNTVAVQGNLALTLINERRWQDLITFNEPRLEAIGNLNEIPIRLRSSIYDLLSLAYLEVGELDKAWDAVETSTNLNKSHIPVYSQHNGYIHFNRGRILLAQGRLDDALREHLLGFEIRKTVLQDHIQTAGSCYRYGDMLARTGKAEDAVAFLVESKRMYGNLGLIGSFSKGGEARSSWRLGKIMEALGRQQEAEEHDKTAREQLRALGKADKTILLEEDFNVLLNYVDS